MRKVRQRKTGNKKICRLKRLLFKGYNVSLYNKTCISLFICSLDDIDHTGKFLLPTELKKEKKNLGVIESDNFRYPRERTGWREKETEKLTIGCGRGVGGVVKAQHKSSLLYLEK